MKHFDEAEIKQLLNKVKSKITDDNWTIKIQDIVKKEPTFYFLYHVDTDRIKEIINGLEEKDFECKIEKITPNELATFIYVFGKNLSFINQNGTKEDLNVHIRICLMEEQKQITVSISKAKYID